MNGRTIPHLTWISALRTPPQHQSERCTSTVPTLKSIVQHFQHGRNRARYHAIRQAETIRNSNSTGVEWKNLQILC